MDELMETFIQETGEHLEMLNEGILRLEKQPGDTALINEIFRSAHTIKGSSGAMGYIRMESVTHAMEDVLHLLRENIIHVNIQIIDLLFRCHDFLEGSLKLIMNTKKEIDDEPVDLLKELKAVIDTHSMPARPTADRYTHVMDGMDNGRDMNDIEKDGQKKQYILKITLCENSEMKSCRVFLIYSLLQQNSEIIEATPLQEDVYRDNYIFEGDTIYVKISTCLDKHGIIGELDSVIDIDEITVEQVTEEVVLCENQKYKSQENEFNDINNIRMVVNEIIGGQKMNFTDTAPNDRALPVKSKETDKRISSEKNESSYIRISTNKVENFSDMIGEMIILLSLLEESAEKLENDNGFMNHLMRMARIMKDVQNMTMSFRMVPLKSTLQKIYRMGRDTAAELGKNVNITIKGEETEIDRSVAEKIVDPLMHLVRNAVSHGVETPEERGSSGKDPMGNVTISAYSKKGNVYISVEDDGKGMDLQKILRKACEKGLAEDDKSYSDEEIIDFVFLPGFSTVDSVNNISGRGVGMDVVRTEIKKIGGKIDVRNAPGRGCSFILRIPINLTVINGTIIDLYGNHFIIPTMYIKHIFKPEESHWVYVAGKRKMVNINNHMVPLIPVNTFFGYDGTSESRNHELIIVLEMEQRLKAICVSSIIGKREIVVKPLGEEFASLDFISGASILGNGKVSLILDVEALFGVIDNT